MSNSVFKFKQFSIKQERSAMKVGTDGVLLGAWTSIKNNPYSILDIGTGTGLIALQLAQKSDAEIIDAIEIDANAYEEAVTNFENSDWNDRLFCYHTSLKEFTEEIDTSIGSAERYDLIVSNPPFYNDDYKTDNDSRNKARFTASLPFEELIISVSKLLSKNGFFSVIIPFKEESIFLELSLKNGLFPSKITRIKGNTNSEIKRSLLQLSFQKSEVNTTELSIEIKRHHYTKEYIALVKEFYLKM